MLQAFLTSLSNIISALNKTSVYRILLYFALLLNAYMLYTYRNELSFMLSKHKRPVVITNVSEIQSKCYELRVRSNAEAVLLYVYQPSGDEKTHKERLVFSTGDNYTPLASTKVLSLFKTNDIVYALKTNGFFEISEDTRQQIYSPVIAANGLNSVLIVGIKNLSGDLIGEVMYVFKHKREVSVYRLQTEAQLFALYVDIADSF